MNARMIGPHRHCTRYWPRDAEFAARVRDEPGVLFTEWRRREGRDGRDFELIVSHCREAAVLAPAYVVLATPEGDHADTREDPVEQAVLVEACRAWWTPTALSERFAAWGDVDEVRGLIKRAVYGLRSDGLLYPPLALWPLTREGVIPTPDGRLMPRGTHVGRSFRAPTRRGR